MFKIKCTKPLNINHNDTKKLTRKIVIYYTKTININETSREIDYNCIGTNERKLTYYIEKCRKMEIGQT